MNTTGYWAAFHESSIELRAERLAEDKYEDAGRLDVWAIIYNRYVLRVLGVRSVFYKMAAEDPTYAKMVLPTLDRKGDVVMADDLEKTMVELESHKSTQLIKAVAILSAINATNHSKNLGAPPMYISFHE